MIADRLTTSDDDLVLRLPRLVRITEALLCVLVPFAAVAFGAGPIGRVSIPAGIAAFVGLSFTQVVVDQRGIEVRRLVAYDRLYPGRTSKAGASPPPERSQSAAAAESSRSRSSRPGASRLAEDRLGEADRRRDRVPSPLHRVRGATVMPGSDLKPSCRRRHLSSPCRIDDRLGSAVLFEHEQDRAPVVHRRICWPVAMASTLRFSIRVPRARPPRVRRLGTKTFRTSDAWASSPLTQVTFPE